IATTGRAPRRTSCSATSVSDRMTRIRAIAVAMLLALALPALPRLAVAAADLRVGYIDSGRIFNEFKDAQEAQQRFDRQVQGWRDEAGEKDNLVKKLRTETRDQSPIL